MPALTLCIRVQAPLFVAKHLSQHAAAVAFSGQGNMLPHFASKDVLQNDVVQDALQQLLPVQDDTAEPNLTCSYQQIYVPVLLQHRPCLLQQLLPVERHPANFSPATNRKLHVRPAFTGSRCPSQGNATKPFQSKIQFVATH